MCFFIWFNSFRITECESLFPHVLNAVPECGADAGLLGTGEDPADEIEGQEQDGSQGAEPRREEGGIVEEGLRKTGKK